MSLCAHRSYILFNIYSRSDHMLFSEFQKEMAKNPSIIRLFPIKYRNGKRGIDYMVTYHDERFVVLRAYDHILIDMQRKIIYTDGDNLNLNLLTDCTERTLEFTLHNLIRDLIHRAKQILSVHLETPDTSSDDLTSSSYDEIRHYYILGSDWQNKIQHDTEYKIYAFADEILKHNEFDGFRKYLLNQNYIPDELLNIIERTLTLYVYTRTKIDNLVNHIDEDTERRHQIVLALQKSKESLFHIHLKDNSVLELQREHLLFLIANSFLYYYPNLLTDYPEDIREKLTAIQVPEIKAITEASGERQLYPAL